MLPSPTGALYACSTPRLSAAQFFLKQLLACRESPLLSDSLLNRFMPGFSPKQQRQLLHELQENQLVVGTDRPRELEVLSVSRILNRRLKLLSQQAKGLICDAEGLCVASAGLHPEEYQYYAAMSVELARLTKRFSTHNDGRKSLEPVWSMIENSGQSKVAFWPLYIAGQRMNMILLGVPKLQQQALVELLWALVHRYEAR